MSLQENKIEMELIDSISISDIEEIRNISESPLEDVKNNALNNHLRREVFVPSYEDNAGYGALKLCVSTFILIIMAPIIVSDLYFGFTDTTSCLKNTPNGLDISMKLYLLLSGYVGLAVITKWIRYFNEVILVIVGFCWSSCYDSNYM
jgi:hypothetical protein